MPKTPPRPPHRPPRNSRPRPSRTAAPPGIAKATTGIEGLDQLTGGGLPAGRPTLVSGGPGCGKTLLAMEFLVRGATRFGEPGVFVAFEESTEELAANVASLGFDLDGLCRKKLLAVDYVHVDPHEIEETGEYNLEGLFIRLGAAIDAVGAKRIVLDTLEVLFGGFADALTLRGEIRRLFRWLKERGVTAIITAERIEGTLTRFGLEEYVSDCVIVLDHRVVEQVSTRRLRIVKYRGSSHGTNEYPFLIGDGGLSVLPVTALGLDYPVSTERVSTGIARLDEMLGGEGYFRGSSVLVSGAAGTGKSSIAASYVDAACRRGEPCVYFAMEESPAQVVRNMRSIGIDLEVWSRKGLLRFQAARPTLFGLEMHLIAMHKTVDEFAPRTVVVDPISSLLTAGTPHDVKAMLVRLFDHLKLKGVTALLTSLTDGIPVDDSTVGVSSLIDTWIQLRDIESGGERNRGLYVVKSRGMAHSNQVREFLISGRGVSLVDVYAGGGGALTGSARMAQVAADEAESLARSQDAARKQRSLTRRRAAFDAQLDALRAQFAAEEEELTNDISEAEGREARLGSSRDEIRRVRTSVASARKVEATAKPAGRKR